MMVLRSMPSAAIASAASARKQSKPFTRWILPSFALPMDLPFVVSKTTGHGLGCREVSTASKSANGVFPLRVLYSAALSTQGVREEQCVNTRSKTYTYGGY